jgi:hypothetical protein
MCSRMVGFNVKSKWLLIGILVWGGLLGGCSLVDVFVKVDTCAPAAGRVVTTPDGGVSGCFPGINIPAGTSAVGFWNVETNSVIATGSPHTCGGKKCQATPGTCYGLACKTKFFPSSPGATTGSCNCLCP